MGAKLDLTGQKPYRLTAIADLDAAHKRAENEQH